MDLLPLTTDRNRSLLIKKKNGFLIRELRIFKLPSLPKKSINGCQIVDPKKNYETYSNKG